MAEIKCLDINSGHQLKAESVVQFARKGEPQEIWGGGKTCSFMLKGECGSAPTLNVLQCASATCFCHRFAMLSCLNLIGWRDGWEGFGQLDRMLSPLHF